MRGLLLALAMVVGLAAPVAAAPPSLVLSPAAIRIGGIASTMLQPVRRAASVTAFGAVLDAGRLATASAKLAAARAAVAQARAKLALAHAQQARAAALFKAQRNISKAQYQAAQAGAQVAVANLQQAQAQLQAQTARVLADWGPALAQAITANQPPVPALVGATACLVRVTLPLGTALAAAPAWADAVPPGGKPVHLRLVGPSPRTPAGSGPSYFYLWSGGNCPPSGMVLPTDLPRGPKRRGVVVPAAAVVWRGGAPLAYRDDGAAGFTPVPLAAALPVPGGYFVPAGPDSPVKSGQRVVVRGAALLLSQAETPARPKQAHGGDDDGD